MDPAVQITDSPCNPIEKLWLLSIDSSQRKDKDPRVEREIRILREPREDFIKTYLQNICNVNQGNYSSFKWHGNNQVHYFCEKAKSYKGKGGRTAKTANRCKSYISFTFVQNVTFQGVIVRKQPCHNGHGPDNNSENGTDHIDSENAGVFDVESGYCSCNSRSFEHECVCPNVHHIITAPENECEVAVVELPSTPPATVEHLSADARPDIKTMLADLHQWSTSPDYVETAELQNCVERAYTVAFSKIPPCTPAQRITLLQVDTQSVHGQSASGHSYANTYGQRKRAMTAVNLDTNCDSVKFKKKRL